MSLVAEVEKTLNSQAVKCIPPSITQITFHTATLTMFTQVLHVNTSCCSEGHETPETVRGKNLKSTRLGPMASPFSGCSASGWLLLLELTLASKPAGELLPSDCRSWSSPATLSTSIVLSVSLLMLRTSSWFGANGSDTVTEGGCRLASVTVT